MRVHRGRPQHKKPRCHTIHLQHLPDICKATLLLNYYLVGRQLLQQTRGAPMGSLPAPQYATWSLWFVSNPGHIPTAPSLATSSTPHLTNSHSADTSPQGTLTIDCHSPPQLRNTLHTFDSSPPLLRPTHFPRDGTRRLSRLHY